MKVRLPYNRHEINVKEGNGTVAPGVNTGYIHVMARKLCKEIVTEPLGFAIVEHALACAFDARDVQKTTFAARLAHFRKLGAMSRPGKGARVEYGENALWRLMLCLELAEFDFPPQEIVPIVARQCDVNGYFQQAIDLARRFPHDDILVAIPVKFMSHKWAGGWKESNTGISFASSRPVGGIRYFKATDHQTFLKAMREPGQRACVFNLSARIRAVEEALKESVS